MYQIKWDSRLSAILSYTAQALKSLQMYQILWDSKDQHIHALKKHWQISKMDNFRYVNSTME